MVAGDASCPFSATVLSLLGFGIPGKAILMAFCKHNCYTLISGNASSPERSSLTEPFYLRSSFLWLWLSTSIAFLWASWCLWRGIWLYRRRCLLPWLLLTGFVVLFLIMLIFIAYFLWSMWKEEQGR